MGDARMTAARILIVEDQGITARDIAARLTHLGYQVVGIAASGTDAIDKAGEERPDAVLMDIKLRGTMDGVQVAQRLHSRFGIPVIYLTAYADDDTLQRAQSTAYGYLVKPFDERELHATIQTAVYRRRLEKQVEDAQTRLQQALDELSTMQQHVVRQERLNALGTMASGIVHDFSNLLSPITGLSELLLVDSALRQDEKRATHYLQTIHAAALDAARIIGRLREFYRARSEAEPQSVVDINPLVEQVVAFTQPSWRDQARNRGVAIRLETDLQLVAPVIGDEAQLREVLTNLVLNAVDALPEGGGIRVATRMDVTAAVIEVIDSGVGMTSEVRQRCFEPFYSTKGERGTGMGLAIVYGIVQRHGGTIEVHSEPGHGTTFRIRLRSGAAPGDAVPGSTSRTRRKLRVLLVDDEPVVCETIAAYLAHDGHAVAIAVDAREGWSRFCAEGFDLVITDSAMPEISGAQLATAIKAISPRTPIIGLTGFGQLVHANAEPADAVDLVVSKPITMAALRDAIDKVLSGHS